MSKQQPGRRNALSGLDKGVEKAITGMEERSASLKMTKTEREKKRKKDAVARKEKERLAKRHRLMIDLREDINLAVEEIAEREGISVSAVINMACLRIVGDDRAKEVDWSEYKRPSKSPRFEWRIELPPIY